MFQFLVGAVAGAAFLKYYENNYGKLVEVCGDDDGDNKTDPLFSQGDMSNLRGTTSSRSTKLNKSANSSGYNEQADTTSEITHINFLTDIVQRLWPYLSKAGEQIILDSVEPQFKEILPGPLKTLHFTKLELGKVPLVLDNILVRELRQIYDTNISFGKNREFIQFEWDVCWNSQCDIQLATDKIAGLAAITFGVRGVTLNGRLQVIAKPLSNSLPCIDAIQFAFVDPPEVELDFTGLANIADMKVKVGGINLVDIKGKVRQIVNDIFASSIVLPNRSHAALAEHVDYRDIFCPAYKGLARVHLHSARGFDIEKTKNPLFGKDDVPDVYIKIRLGVEEFWKSSTVMDDCNPTWDPKEEFHDFLYCNAMDQTLEIQAWDYDHGALDTDDILGTARVTLRQVLLQSRGSEATMEVQLLKEAESKGKNATMTDQFVTISLETLPFTTADLDSIQKTDEIFARRRQLDSKDEKKWKKTEGKRVVGLSTVLISHASDLPFDDENDSNSFVKVFIGATGEESNNDKRVFLGQTSVKAGTTNPKYETAIQTPVTLDKVMNARLDGDEGKSYIFQMLTLEKPDDDVDKDAKVIGEIFIPNKNIYENTDPAGNKSSSIRATKIIGKHHQRDDNKFNTKLAFTISFAGVEKSKREARESTFKSSGTISGASSGSPHASIEIVSKRDSNDNGDNNDVVIRTSNEELAGVQALSTSTALHDNMIRVKIVKAWGFQTEKKKLFKKADIPDVYCMVKFGSSPAVWRLPTIVDSENPKWNNEARDYSMESMNQVISIDVWDENRRSDDDYYGNARTSVGKIILNGGSLDLEIKPDDSKGNKSAIAKEIKENNKAVKNKIVKLGNKIGMDLVEDKPASKMFITVECYKL